MTLTEIHRKIGIQKTDFATVFRFIQVLEKKKLVHQHYWEDNQIRYEINEDHHHYLICRICHNSEPIHQCELTLFEKKIQKQTSFLELTHRLEFFGVCPNCQKKR